MNLDKNTFARLIEEADADARRGRSTSRHCGSSAGGVRSRSDKADSSSVAPKPSIRLEVDHAFSRFPRCRCDRSCCRRRRCCLVVHGAGVSYALAHFIQPIIDAKSATCKTTVEIQGMPPGTGEMMVFGTGRFRQTTSPNGVMIWDLDKGKELCLDTAKKQAVLFDIANMPKAKKGEQDRSPACNRNYASRK